MQSKIAIAELEPSFTAEFAKRIHKLPGFLRSPPTSLWIGHATKRVKYGVKIWRDMQAKMLEVVAGIHNDDQFRAEHTIKPERELGSSDTAAQREHTTL